MSITVSNWVWKHSSHKGSALIMLLAIADNANDDGGGAYPSIATLARKTRMSVRQTQRLVQLLVASGELEIEKPGTRQGLANTYRVTFNVGSDMMSLPKESDDPACPEGGDIAMSNPSDIAMSNQPSYNHPIEPPLPVSFADATETSDHDDLRADETEAPNDLEVVGELRDSAPAAAVKERTSHQQVMDWYQEESGPGFNGGQEGRAVKWMLGQGFTLEDIQECYQHLRGQHWRDPATRLSLQTVKKEIVPWKKWRESGVPPPSSTRAPNPNLYPNRDTNTFQFKRGE